MSQHTHKWTLPNDGMWQVYCDCGAGAGLVDVLNALVARAQQEAPLDVPVRPKAWTSDDARRKWLAGEEV